MLDIAPLCHAKMVASISKIVYGYQMTYRVEITGGAPLEKMLEIVQWIISSGVIDRGILHHDNIAVNEAKMKAYLPQTTLWELFLMGLNDVAQIGSPFNDDINYNAIFDFQESKDAVAFKLLFSET